MSGGVGAGVEQDAGGWAGLDQARDLHVGDGLFDVAEGPVEGPFGGGAVGGLVDAGVGG